MLKKGLCLFVGMMLFFCQINVTHATNLASGAESAILIDAQSQQILYQKKATKKLYPASTTKIMTMILLFEAIKDKRLKWDDILTCSAYAASMGGSQVYLEENETMSVFELFKCIAIASANDACVVIGENIAGSHEEFVSMMNEKAKILNLENTHFVNCTGLHDPNHYTCAKDLSIMAAYLLQIGGKKLLSVTSLYDSYVREKTKQKFWLVNTNKLLKQYPGVDGLKTGFTKEAGYCIVTTCKKKDLRLIGVLMNEGKPQTRNEDMKGLLSYGFSKYQQVKLYQKGEVIDTIKVKDMVEQKINVVSHKNLYYLSEKSNQKKLKKEIIYGSLQLPIDQKKSIGKLVLYNNHQEVASYPLYSEINVKKMSFLDKLVRVYKSLI
ncbi:MAG: D-alanyl-D-alanine carboxypeptidase family protein [Bacillota bacterium]|nr:D-alanyl-D-alanine carboxypeptidase family protein [Bacillota bacterium]